MAKYTKPIPKKSGSGGLLPCLVIAILGMWAYNNGNTQANTGTRNGVAQPKASVMVGVPVNGNSCTDAIRRVWPEEYQAQAFLVTHLEDGNGNPARVHSNTNIRGNVISYDLGCFQANDRMHLGKGGGWIARDQMFDPDFSASWSLWLWRQQGWQPWSSVCGQHPKYLVPCGVQ